MRLYSLGLYTALVAVPVTAFLPPAPARGGAVPSSMVRQASPSPDQESPSFQRVVKLSQKLFGYAAVAMATWQSSISMSPSFHDLRVDTVQVAQAAPKRNDRNQAASQGSRVNKDAESLLRWGLPIDSKEARDLQESIENVKDGIRSKRLSSARGDAQKAKTQLSQKKATLLKQVRSGEEATATEQIKVLGDKIDELLATFDEEVGRGSEQERTKLDKLYVVQTEAARALGKVEALMVPADYKVAVPEEFSDLPQLQGRAEIEMVLGKADPAEKFDIKGKLYDKLKVRMVIDGYNAPLTGGNFVDLVTKGFYNKMAISRSDGFVVQFGDPEPQGDKHGYIPPGKTEDRKLPLEVFLRGDDAPLYGITSEDDGRGYAAPVLPFQAYGTLGMAREEYNPDSASSQVFWLLFESDLTPAGKNLLDGRYACFGYTIDGAELLAGVKEGDVIESAKVTSGMDKFIKGAV